MQSLTPSKLRLKTPPTLMTQLMTNTPEEILETPPKVPQLELPSDNKVEYVVNPPSFGPSPPTSQRDEM